MLISYNEACAKDCSTLEQDLDLCERSGFDCIELRLDMLRYYLTRRSVDELAGFFQTSRLRPHAFNALYLYPEFLGPEDDPERQAALLEEFNLSCRVGRAIGSEYLIVVPPLQRDPAGGPYTGSWEDTFAACVRILSRLSDLALPYGMKLCFELVGFERSSVRSVAQADAIVRAVNRPNVGFVFDSYNMYLNGGSILYRHRLRPAGKNLRRPPDERRRRPPGAPGSGQAPVLRRRRGGHRRIPPGAEAGGLPGYRLGGDLPPRVLGQASRMGHCRGLSDHPGGAGAQRLPLIKILGGPGRLK